MAAHQLSGATLETGNALFAAGRYESARAHFASMIDQGLDAPAVRSNLAQSLKRLGLMDEAFDEFEEGFRQRRQRNPATSANDSAASSNRVATVALSHLAEQLAYLASTGCIDWYGEDKRRELDSLSKLMRDFYGVQGTGTLPEDSPAWVKCALERCSYRDEEPFQGGILNPDMSMAAIKLTSGGDQAFILDHVLTGPALERMRRLFLQSMIWFDVRPGRGYLGAHLHDGLATPFIRAVYRELMNWLNKEIGHLQLAQMWAFKHLYKSQGIDLHADQADWNFNFWPTSADALVDQRPDAGGMTIWDFKIDPDMPFHLYNSAPARLAADVAESKCPKYVIPYRGNRAVIFPSKYVHRTTPAEFKNDYVSHRVNITLLADKSQ